MGNEIGLSKLYINIPVYVSIYKAYSSTQAHLLILFRPSTVAEPTF